MVEWPIRIFIIEILTYSPLATPWLYKIKGIANISLSPLPLKEEFSLHQKLWDLLDYGEKVDKTDTEELLFNCISRCSPNSKRLENTDVGKTGRFWSKCNMSAIISFSYQVWILSYLASPIWHSCSISFCLVSSFLVEFAPCLVGKGSHFEIHFRKHMDRTHAEDGIPKNHKNLKKCMVMQ